MPVSVLAAAASFLLFLPSSPSAAINPGLGMPWAASDGDLIWEEEFYPVGRRPSTSSLNPRLTWLARGTQQTDRGSLGPIQKRGGGVAMVKRHPSAAISFAARKRQQYLTMPYHPLARFRGIDSPASSAPVIGPFRPPPPFALPLRVSPSGPRSDSIETALEEDVANEDPSEREEDLGSLSAGQLLSILLAVAKERGLGMDRGRITKGLRFGITRR